MRTLFDVNVLIALFDPDHIHHERAHRWWAAHEDEGWATCPITENGLVRVISQPAYPKAISVTAAVDLLRSATSIDGHAFWPDDVSLADSGRIDGTRILGAKQLTDVYLVALAIKRRGRLATFDTSIPLAAVKGAAGRHVVVV